MEYCELEPIFSNKKNLLLTDIRGWNILLLTGIATPQHLKEDLNEYTGNNALTTLSYPDHHAFTKKDIRLINETFERMSTPKIIITTEKDKARLIGIEGLSAEIKENIYSLPIKVRFMLDKEKTFNDKIISYVRKNSRNSILAKKEDDNKSKNRHHSGNRSRTISSSEITDSYEFPYKDIPNFPVSTVEGHAGKLIFGKLGDKDIMAMEGRFHFYEGLQHERGHIPYPRNARVGD